MTTQLKFLEIDNFKSYEGKVLIGPLRGFSAIVGPNGSGKSNLMDAISFVFGERPNALRVKKLSDLIHGSNVKQPVSNRCSVTAVLVTKDGRTETEKTFQRSATDRERGADSEYRVDQMVVSRDDYVTELEKLNIIIKPRNFLVFQGQVMNIATQNPKQRTAWLEKVSRSGELREEYESLEKEYNEAQEQMRKQAKVKHEILAAEKEARANKKEADDYESRKLRVEELDITIRLMKLCYLEREIEKLKQQLNEKKDREEEEEAKRAEMEKEQDDLKKKLSQLSRELNKQEQEVRKHEIQLNEKRPRLTSLESKINQLHETSEKEKKVIEDNQRRLDDAKASIGKLDEEVRIVQRAQKDAEEESQRLEQEGGSSLTPEQLERYRELKDQANQQAGSLREQLESVKRELAVEREMLQASEREAKHKRSDLQAREREESALQEKRESLNTFIEQSNATLEAKKEQREALQQQLGSVQENQIELQEKLSACQRLLSEVSVTRNELERHERKRDVIEKLKQVFGETSVYGRLIELTEPANPRFRSAVTRIFARHMNSIVVNTQSVAADCIKYLREQEMEPEHFLPIDTIKAREIDIRLRELDPKCRLVYDIVEVRHQDRNGVQKILKFVCQNALVCEDDRDRQHARRVAYGNPHDRQQVVTLEGTLYEKSGVISGGAQAISAKAKSWSTKEYEKLKKEEATLQEQLAKINKVRRKESELHSIDMEISTLISRIKSARKDVSDAQKRIDEIQRDSDRLKATCKALESQVRSKQLDVDRVQGRLQQAEQSLDTVEDQVFSEFCEEIGVHNIRDFEKRDLEEKQKREKRMFELKKHFNKLRQQLEYEQQGKVKIERKITSSENAIRNAEAALELAQAELAAGNDQVAAVEGALAAAREDLERHRQNREEQQRLVDEKKKQMQDAQRALQKIQRQITSEGMVLDQKRNERLQLLQDCRMEGIELPMEKGSMDDIHVGEMPLTQGANSSMSSQDASSASQQSTPTSSSAQRSQSTGRAVWAKEPKIKLDYSSLPAKVRDLTGHDQQQKAIKERENDLENLRSELASLHPPIAEADTQLNAALNRKKAAQKETEDARKRFTEVQTRFVKTRKERLKRFKQCLNTVSERIDEIYKELNNDMTAQAYITPDSQDLPFTEGVSYSLVVPGKQYRFIDQLSGGEKTLAALSLLFAVHRVRPSPFYIMDEIDAALDNQNIGRVSAFMNKKSSEFQCIVISLKEELFLHADCLVGIYPEHSGKSSALRNVMVSNVPRSKALMFDLSAHTDKRRDGGTRSDDEDEGTSGDDGEGGDDEGDAVGSPSDEENDEAASSGRISSEEGSDEEEDEEGDEDGSRASTNGSEV